MPILSVVVFPVPMVKLVRLVKLPTKLVKVTGPLLFAMDNDFVPLKVLLKVVPPLLDVKVRSAPNVKALLYVCAPLVVTEPVLNVVELPVPMVKAPSADEPPTALAKLTLPLPFVIESDWGPLTVPAKAMPLDVVVKVKLLVPMVTALL